MPKKNTRKYVNIAENPLLPTKGTTVSRQHAEKKKRFNMQHSRISGMYRFPSSGMCSQHETKYTYEMDPNLFQEQDWTVYLS